MASGDGVSTPPSAAVLNRRSSQRAVPRAARWNRARSATADGPSGWCVIAIESQLARRDGQPAGEHGKQGGQGRGPPADLHADARLRSLARAEIDERPTVNRRQQAAIVRMEMHVHREPPHSRRRVPDRRPEPGLGVGAEKPCSFRIGNSGRLDDAQPDLSVPRATHRRRHIDRDQSPTPINHSQAGSCADRDGDPEHLRCLRSR